MAAARLTPVRFTPSRVEGHAPVAFVEFHPDRLILVIDANQTTTLRFRDVARRPSWLWRLRGARPSVGARDWFAAPADRWFRLDSAPPVTVVMPIDDGPRGETFVRVREVITAEGYTTDDLG